jgi:hypothetical protein
MHQLQPALWEDNHPMALLNLIGRLWYMCPMPISPRREYQENFGIMRLITLHMLKHLATSYGTTML